LKFFKKKEKSFNPLFMYVIIHMKKNKQIWYIFFNTQSYNLFVKKDVKIFVLHLKRYWHSKWSCTCAWRWKIGLNYFPHMLHWSLSSSFIFPTRSCAPSSCAASRSTSSGRCPRSTSTSSPASSASGSDSSTTNSWHSPPPRYHTKRGQCKIVVNLK